MTTAILTLSCRNRAGIVGTVGNFLYQHGIDIREAQQFDDRASGQFFMRVVFEPLDASAPKPDFTPIADSYGMNWAITETAHRPRAMILVSRFDHCLVDLLYRQRTGELPMDIAGIIANHPRETYEHLDLDGIPFHHLPIAAETKMEQEAEIWRLVRDSGAELVILARYMQVLSDALVAKLAGRCINIHHSFLPGFKGAKPYHQAYARGVKLIGATAHYVTTALDEGPIIEQDVERISHGDTPETLVRKGRDIERRVLARAVLFHVERRVFISGSKTVVFGG
ncbi:formyltetrahydrofolate deformylase [Acidiphilium acidophilum]|uniref:formyltetrahydrofolate deformylase n=1 Tax=Acidiphilium acidophilum TaxID=76588 RepID=UPI002E8E6F2A|nr:formyltetrahydrofolate deformylase [Acidiphilium acidophilum]